MQVFESKTVKLRKICEVFAVTVSLCSGGVSCFWLHGKKTLILNQLSRTAVLYIRSKILSPLFGIYCTSD